MNDIEKIEDIYEGNDTSMEAAHVRAGVSGEAQSKSSASNTPLPTPSRTSSGVSNQRLQSTKSSRTSASSEPLLHPPNAPLGHISVYMQIVDLLHIGAQFSLDVDEDEGHIDIEVEVEQKPNVARED